MAAHFISRPLLAVVLAAACCFVGTYGLAFSMRDLTGTSMTVDTVAIPGPAEAAAKAYAKRQTDIFRAAHSTHMQTPFIKAKVLTGAHAPAIDIHNGGPLQERFKMYSNQTVFIFGAYHKTGCEFALNFMARMRQNDNTDDINFVAGRIEEDQKLIFRTGEWDNFYYEPRLGIVELLPDYRLVHMIRDPADIILSAYRFHAQCPPGEPWLLDPLTTLYDFDTLKEKVGERNPKLLAKINYAVDVNLSLCQFYQLPIVTETDGVVVEALRSQREVELMADNYVRSSSNPKVLQVPMEQIQLNFAATINCIFSFLGKIREVNEAEAFDTVAELDVANVRADDAHVTQGKYNNSVIRSLIMTMPHVINARKAIYEKVLHANRCK